MGKISDLAAATIVGTADKLLLLQGGTDKSATLAVLLDWLQGAGRQRIIAAATPQATHTGDTIEFTFATIVIPGGSLGPNGRLEVETLWSYTNNANTKTLKVKLGTAAFVSLGPTTTLTLRHPGLLINDGSETAQLGFNAGATTGIGTSGGAIPTYAVDTTVNQNLTITGQLSNSADSIKLEAYIVRAIYIS